LMPSGVTTRAHTRWAGASMMLCRSTIMTTQAIPLARAVGFYVVVDAIARTRVQSLTQK
jgi:hypothetical protein